jgi:hypothetical protein
MFSLYKTNKKASVNFNFTLAFLIIKFPFNFPEFRWLICFSQKNFALAATEVRPHPI